MDERDSLGILSILTVSDLDPWYSVTDLARGQELYHSGCVLDREIIRDDTLGDGIEALVMDSNTYYEVSAFPESDNGIALLCDCSRNGDCEHGVALLLSWIEEPDSFAPLTLGSLLDQLASDPQAHQALADKVPDIDELLQYLSTSVSNIDEFLDLSLDELQDIAMSQPVTTSDHRPSVMTDEGVRQLLDGPTVAELRKIGRRHDVKLKGTRKADIIDQLVEHLQSRAQQPDFLKGLTDDEYNLLRTVYTMYGLRESLTWNELVWAWDSQASAAETQALRQILEGLCEYGLLYRCRIHGGGEHYHWLPYLQGVRLPVVAPDVGTYRERRLRRLSPAEEGPALPASLAQLVAFAERHTLRLRKPARRHPQVRHYPWLGDWDHDPDEVDRLVKRQYGYYYPQPDSALTVPPAQPLLTDKVVDQCAQWLGVSHAYVSWLVLIAIAAGILTTPSGKQTTVKVQREQWKSWYSQSPASQLRAVFDIWRSLPIGLTELGLAQRREQRLRVHRTLAFNVQFTPTDLAQEFVLARGFVARLLQELAADVWYDWGSFAEAARQTDADFLHNYHGSEIWGFTINGKKRLDPLQRGDWDRSYGLVLAAFLEGPLRWMGAVQVGYHGKRLVAFRLTSTGVWLLRGEGQPAPLFPVDRESRPVTWLGDTTFRLVPGPVAAKVFALAQMLATPTRDAFVYEVSDEGIQQAFAAGVDPSMMAATFEEAGAPLPETTHARISDLWSRFGYIHLYENLTVLEFADDFALGELLANTQLRRHVIHQFSPRLVVIEDSAVDALVQEFIKKGYTPKVVQ